MSTREIEGSGSGGEPDLKRRRLLDAGGPVEDDETARQKMREAKVYEPEGDVAAGFDPDNVADIKHFYARQSYDIYRIKPMGYFAEKGDLKMMRWLYVNGADTRDEEVGFYFPMIRAVSRGHTDVCKWLFAHGASDDVQRRTNVDPFFPLNNDIGCLSLAKKREMTRWLTLNGALCKENTRGELDIRVMRKDISGGGKGQLLFEWANDLQNARASFLTFLMGTLSPVEHIIMYSPLSLRQLLLKKLASEQATNRLLDSLPIGQYRQLWDELLAAGDRGRPIPLNILSGKSGILELVCAFVGIVRGREARIIRQLVEILPHFNKRCGLT